MTEAVEATQYLQYAWLIPMFPFLGVIINGFLGRKIERPGVGIIAVLCVATSFVLTVLCVKELATMDPGANGVRRVIYDILPWIHAGSFQLNFGVMIDPLSSVMLLVVTGVGTLIHIYSLGYMAKDEGYPRFFVYLNLFTGSMLTLVIANSLALLFVGWELVGLCSYLLIGFWYHKDSAADAGKKAFIVNRVGDFGFLIGMMTIFWVFGSVNFRDIFNIVETNAPVTAWFMNGGAAPVMQVLREPTVIFGLPLVVVLSLCMFLGATGKSAQIPLYVWLPDAMEGPTPVSALIHAATMVTAGVYMVARMSMVFAVEPLSLMVVAGIGCLTAIFAATIGLVQNDIKRVLAYSTVSQLGYMFLACGVGAYAVGIFHLMTHAFFKALLFLGSGSVIHACEHSFHDVHFHGDPQDMRNMGGLSKYMKITAYTFWVGALAIAGVPFFSGFFSKDEILWKAFSTPVAAEPFGKILWAVGAVAAVMTAFYMFRLIFMTFHGKTRLPEGAHPHESPKSMTGVLVALAVAAIIGGWWGVPHVFPTPLFGDGFYKWLAPVFTPAETILAERDGYNGMEYKDELLAEMVTPCPMMKDGKPCPKPCDAHKEGMPCPKAEGKPCPKMAEGHPCPKAAAAEAQAKLPPGHPPVDEMKLPLGHPPVDGQMEMPEGHDQMMAAHAEMMAEHHGEEVVEEAVEEEAETHAVMAHDEVAEDVHGDEHDMHAAAAVHGESGDAGHGDAHAEGHEGGHGDPAVIAMEKKLMLLSIVLAFVGILVALYMYNINPAVHHGIREALGPIHTLLLNKYFIDEIYSYTIVRPGRIISEFFLWKVFDMYVIDGIVNGVALLVRGISSVIRRVQTGVVLNYALVIVLGVLSILAYYMFGK